MSTCSHRLSYPIARLLILVFAIFLLGGCVASTTFEDFKNEIRYEIASLRNEQSKQERDIATLRDEIGRITNRQQDLSTDVRDSLSKSETKLKEMEDRVIEIRLQIQRAGQITR